ncbi:MAG TPA: SRPBCC family protein [Gemmatimonadaceae bacterium]|nr:SRPBCC family protein [Gemmatimonadaceae bacterium]
MTSISIEHVPGEEREQADERSRTGGGNGGRQGNGGRHINVGETERWLSLAGGAALALYALKRRSPAALALAAGGAALIGRGATGHSPVYQRLGVDTADPNAVRRNVLAAVLPSRKLESERAYTILRPRHELYAFWRNLENLPQFMEHLESVTVTGDGRSHWVTRAPIGKPLSWDAEITEEVEDRVIAWRSLPGSAVENSGQVHFSDAPDGRGTMVRARIIYSAPGGKTAEEIARFFGKSASQQLRDDLRRFKQVMEAGETPTTEGQPHGQRKEANR